MIHKKIQNIDKILKENSKFIVKSIWLKNKSIFNRSIFWLFIMLLHDIKKY